MYLKNQPIRNTVVIVRSRYPKGLYTCDMLARKAAPALDEEAKMDAAVWNELRGDVTLVALLNVDEGTFCFYDLDGEDMLEDIVFYQDCLIIAAGDRLQQDLIQQLN